MIRVSPYHKIELNPALLQLLEEPPEHDYVMRQLSQKIVNGQPLIQGELIIAGSETLEEYPLAREYPVHFRKTYYPICFHQDPAKEFENHAAVSKIIDVPAPIGYTRTTFRSCFLPGIPFDRLSPFGVEPEERNVQIGSELDAAAAIGLWKMLEGIYVEVRQLHQNGLAHGDLFLHNVIVSTAPVGPYLIDFEQAVLRADDTSDEQWQATEKADLVELLKQAMYLQCALGHQRGEMAEAAIAALPDIVRDPDYFERAIARQVSRV